MQGRQDFPGDRPSFSPARCGRHHSPALFPAPPVGNNVRNQLNRGALRARRLQEHAVAASRRSVEPRWRLLAGDRSGEIFRVPGRGGTQCGISVTIPSPSEGHIWKKARKVQVVQSEVYDTRAVFFWAGEGSEGARLVKPQFQHRRR